MNSLLIPRAVHLLPMLLHQGPGSPCPRQSRHLTHFPETHWPGLLLQRVWFLFLSTASLFFPPGLSKKSHLLRKAGLASLTLSQEQTRLWPSPPSRAPVRPPSARRGCGGLPPGDSPPSVPPSAFSLEGQVPRRPCSV